MENESAFILNYCVEMISHSLGVAGDIDCYRELQKVNIVFTFVRTGNPITFTQRN